MKSQMKWTMAMAAAVMVVAVGCSTFDRAYDKEVTWTQEPVVHVFTNSIVVTNYVPQYTEETVVSFETNAVSGEVVRNVAMVPVQTGTLSVVETNRVPVYETNYVDVPVTNLVAKPGAESIIQGTATIVNTFAPGLGSLFALALGGLYHGYRQVRNKKVNQALVQGVETARAILETTPQGQQADAQFLKWLMENQKAAGVFTVVSDLVDQHSDNPAAKLTAQEILERIQRAQGSS
jgi:hypothetical protein